MTNQIEIIRLNKSITDQEECQKKNFKIIQQNKHYYSNEMIKIISNSMCSLSTPLFKVNGNK
jgi:uncharacterized membrane protein YgaE (UPF0421/DUF939 family)